MLSCRKTQIAIFLVGICWLFLPQKSVTATNANTPNNLQASSECSLSYRGNTDSCITAPPLTGPGNVQVVTQAVSNETGHNAKYDNGNSVPYYGTRSDGPTSSSAQGGLQGQAAAPIIIPPDSTDPNIAASCYWVDNNIPVASSDSIFVPFKTAREWNDFVTAVNAAKGNPDNNLSNITLTPCAVPYTVSGPTSKTIPLTLPYTTSCQLIDPSTNKVTTNTPKIDSPNGYGRAGQSTMAVTYNGLVYNPSFQCNGNTIVTSSLTWRADPQCYYPSTCQGSPLTWDQTLFQFSPSLTFVATEVGNSSVTGTNISIPQGTNITLSWDVKAIAPATIKTCSSNNSAVVLPPYTGTSIEIAPSKNLLPDNVNIYTLSCTDSNNLTSTATVSVTVNSLVNGVCGSANGNPVSTAPTSGLCQDGSPTAVSGNGPWTWTCLGNGQGSTSQSCAAPLLNLIGGSCPSPSSPADLVSDPSGIESINGTNVTVVSPTTKKLPFYMSWDWRSANITGATINYAFPVMTGAKPGSFSVVGGAATASLNVPATGHELDISSYSFSSYALGALKKDTTIAISGTFSNPSLQVTCLSGTPAPIGLGVRPVGAKAITLLNQTVTRTDTGQPYPNPQPPTTYYSDYCGSTGLCPQPPVYAQWTTVQSSYTVPEDGAYEAVWITGGEYESCKDSTGNEPGRGPKTYTAAASEVSVLGNIGLSCTGTPVDGTCGTANGVPVSSAPTSGLCATGTSSSLSGSGPWSWTCNGSDGGSTASCAAPLSSTCADANGGKVCGNPPKCGSAVVSISPPGDIPEDVSLVSGQYCSSGTAVLGSVVGNGLNYQCTNTTWQPANCSAPILPCTLDSDGYCASLTKIGMHGHAYKGEGCGNEIWTGQDTADVYNAKGAVIGTITYTGKGATLGCPPYTVSSNPSDLLSLDPNLETLP